jgi:hypothetical protein
MYEQETFDLFTSNAAKSKGVRYLDRQVQTVAYYTAKDGTHNPIKIYGNPSQPDFEFDKWVGTRGQASFCYPPYPSPESIAAWSKAPTRSDGIPIWVMHGPPFKRLDASSVTGLKGCEAQSSKVAEARPKLCVFGHFHFSHGVERVWWQGDGEVAKAEILVTGNERRRAEGGGPPKSEGELDFTGGGAYGPLKWGDETLFVNAAWMTDNKKNPERNLPVIVVDLRME